MENDKKTKQIDSIISFHGIYYFLDSNNILMKILIII